MRNADSPKTLYELVASREAHYFGSMQRRQKNNSLTLVLVSGEVETNIKVLYYGWEALNWIILNGLLVILNKRIS